LVFLMFFRDFAGFCLAAFDLDVVLLALTGIKPPSIMKIVSMVVQSGLL